MKYLELTAYGFYLLLIVGGGVLAISSRTLIRALVGLITALFGVAGMYFLLNAPFVALMQLLIYVGAVTVLIFFAIMLTRPPAGAEECEPRPKSAWIIPVLTGIAPALLLGVMCLTSFTQTVEKPVLNTARELGQGLLGPYALAFELISVVLFVAMGGAVILGFKRRESR
ncbi:MAG TPA: NADH-quinone oxidoreductase subunit J [Desulfomicrobiaceae bacterium]|nr:NADH-quinone oxidoreductase subunit J [Desulfomicrobiaceae bacterium]